MTEEVTYRPYELKPDAYLLRLDEGETILNEELWERFVNKMPAQAKVSIPKLVKEVKQVFVDSEAYTLSTITSGALNKAAHTLDVELTQNYINHLSSKTYYAEAILARACYVLSTNYGSEFSYNAFESPEAYTKMFKSLTQKCRDDIQIIGHLYNQRGG